MWRSPWVFRTHLVLRRRPRREWSHHNLLLKDDDDGIGTRDGRVKIQRLSWGRGCNTCGLYQLHIQPRAAFSHEKFQRPFLPRPTVDCRVPLIHRQELTYCWKLSGKRPSFRTATINFQHSPIRDFPTYISMTISNCVCLSQLRYGSRRDLPSK